MVFFENKYLFHIGLINILQKKSDIFSVNTLFDFIHC